MRIGLDLDNTLICYDQAFLRVGKDEGLLPASFAGNKAAVKRALLVERPDGSLWEGAAGPGLWPADRCGVAFRRRD